MLDWLAIKNFVLIESLELELKSGLTTITGESGAGKSIIVDAIGLLMGDRSDESYIKHGQEQCDIQAVFDLSKQPIAVKWLAENELTGDDTGICLVRRILRRQKPTRAYINGISVTISQLKALGQFLVDIHGQHEHHSLLSKTTQQQILDQQANNQDLLSQIGDLYPKLKTLEESINNFERQQDALIQRADLLQFHCDELATLEPKENEWEQLESTHKRLNHQVDISQTTESVYRSLVNDDVAICDSLERHIQQLDKFGQFDSDFHPLIQMLQEANINLQEVAQELRPYFESDLLSASEIAQIEHRFAKYHELARKHKILPENLHLYFQQLQQELASISQPEVELGNLKKQFEDTLKNYDNVAKKLTTSREKTAKTLSQKIAQSMHELGMEGGLFEIVLTASESRFTRFGNESVDFYVSTNPGQTPQRLNKVASGGEISRISLALQVVAAESITLSTLIFDEVDVGISGKIAEVVAHRLRRISQHAQVLCITHLPQVAVQGHQQFSVRKQTDNAATSTIIELDQQQRIEEIAHMNSGSNLTNKALEHAREMLEQVAT